MRRFNLVFGAVAIVNLAIVVGIIYVLIFLAQHGLSGIAHDLGQAVHSFKDGMDGQ
jgi:Sec-independent protein translocase protein TatA